MVEANRAEKICKMLGFSQMWGLNIEIFGQLCSVWRQEGNLASMVVGVLWLHEDFKLAMASHRTT